VSNFEGDFFRFTSHFPFTCDALTRSVFMNAQQYQRNLCIADSTGLSSFVLPLLPLQSAKSREIPRKFELIAVQGHRRSSTLVPIESAYATSY